MGWVRPSTSMTGASRKNARSFSTSRVAEATTTRRVGAPRRQLAEIAEDEVDVEGALVRLVDDQGVVGAEIAVALDLREQDAVGHQLDARVPRGVPLKPHLVAHLPAEPRSELRRDPGGDAARRDSPRLGMADHRAGAPPGLETDLRELGALARTGRADHERDRMPGDRPRDVSRPLRDWQIRADGGQPSRHVSVTFMELAG